uniref:FUN14 domain-containing protein 2 n=1 Tax=Oncorhynchus mykiss TaxID=8022 RepID=A0A8C7RKJ2_ONCMY
GSICGDWKLYKSEETFEVMDVVEYAKKQRWWNKIFGENSGPVAEKYNVATQLAIGGVSGWCAGYLFQKVGKLAASAVGGGFFFLQIANHTGYIKVDWKRVERDVNNAKKQLKLNTEKPTKETPLISYVKQIHRLGGFLGMCQFENSLLDTMSVVKVYAWSMHIWQEHWL